MRSLTLHLLTGYKYGCGIRVFMFIRRVLNYGTVSYHIPHWLPLCVPGDAIA